MYKIIPIFILLFMVVSFKANSQSTDEFKKNDSYYKSFSYFTGFSEGDLNEKDDYMIVPSIFRFAFDVDKLEVGAADIVEYIADNIFNNPSLTVKGETEFLVELFLIQLLVLIAILRWDLIFLSSMPIQSRIE
ncbi:MAG: hypothetical protein KAJ14_03150 [Candidatus Omnitrophica bacterium]|nr:hypothetical protein [Candidatus Omnitrophota bacterium]